MELKVKKVPIEQPEILEIRCHKVTDEVQEIITFVKSRQGQLSARKDGRDIEIPVIDVFYAESVDNRVFIYTAKDSFEIRGKLYELEDMLGSDFLRISKSAIVNLNRIYAIRRNLAASSEISFRGTHKQIYVSRAYIKVLKERLEEKRLER